MQLLAPDILADARGMSMFLCVLGLIVGVAVLLLGWWTHRFWVVLSTTVLAGICGLSEAPAFGAQPLLAAVLVGIAAGVLAMALVRFVAFATGGLILLATVQALAPVADHALVLFVLGGLLALYFFRLWIMTLTGLTGTLLILYSGLCLADGLGKLDAVRLAEERVRLFNWIGGGIILLGLVVQLFLDWRFGGEKQGNNSGGSFKAVLLKLLPWSWPWVQRIFRKPA